MPKPFSPSAGIRCEGEYEHHRTIYRLKVLLLTCCHICEIVGPNPLGKYATLWLRCFVNSFTACSLHWRVIVPSYTLNLTNPHTTGTLVALHFRPHVEGLLATAAIGPHIAQLLFNRKEIECFAN